MSKNERDDIPRLMLISLSIRNVRLQTQRKQLSIYATGRRHKND